MLVYSKGQLKVGLYHFGEGSLIYSSNVDLIATKHFIIVWIKIVSSSIHISGQSIQLNSGTQR